MLSFDPDRRVHPTERVRKGTYVNATWFSLICTYDLDRLSVAFDQILRYLTPSHRTTTSPSEPN